MFVVLAGEVAITQHNALGREEPIVTHGRVASSAS
jgi:hypothetical protein